MIALVQRYPELEKCYEDACAAYDKLIDEESIEFHAAYIANLEATFTPLFKVILDNRDSLFGGGDRRVASLMMWHFVEEIEHRVRDCFCAGTSIPTRGTASSTSAPRLVTWVRWRRPSLRPSTGSFPSKTAARPLAS